MEIKKKIFPDRVIFRMTVFLDESKTTCKMGLEFIPSKTGAFTPGLVLLVPLASQPLRINEVYSHALVQEALVQ